MTTTDIPQLRTRKPTGKPPWPMILLAGGEKSGKSWAAAAFSASDLIGRTFYVELGEHYADEYGSIPGARYEIVEHDGSYRDLGGQIYAATQVPRAAGKPNCIVVDSMTLLWDLLSDEAQQTATRRKNKGPDGEAQITMDLWNVAKKRWNDILNLLRSHDGPVILTARLEQVAVVGPGGTPTTEKTLKVKAEKNLPYEVDVIVQIPQPRTFQITGLRSVRFQLEPGAAMAAPDFTVDQLLRKLGLDVDGATAPRAVTLPRPAGEPQHEVAEAVVRKEQRERVDIAPREHRGERNPFDPDFDLPPMPGSASARPATDAQLTKIAILFQEKRNVDKGRGEVARILRLKGLGMMVGREIKSGRDLTLREAQEVIESLLLEPNHIAPAEESQSDPGSDSQLGADLAAAIQEAGDETELAAVMASVDGAVEGGKLPPDHGNELLASATAKRRGWSHRTAVGAGLNV